MNLTNEEKIAVLKRIFNEDVEQFGKFFFPHHLKLETPKFHKEIYSALKSDKKFIVRAAPRGHAKSTIIDLVYLAWIIVNSKAKFILLVSDTYSQAVLFLEALKAEFESNDGLKAFYGKLESKNWSEGEIIVNGVMVKALGAGMKVRGLKFRENRPDLIIVDDLENDELVESKERREKLERWFNGALVPSLDKDGRVVVIGTVLHYDSLLYKILAKDKYIEFDKKVYRAIMDENALWPEHLNLDELENLKQQYLSKGQLYLFYQEYMNDPISAENRKFKIENFKYYEDKDIASFRLGNYLMVDRAYSKEKTADATGIILISVDIDNNWYVRIAERLKGTEKEIIDRIFDLKGGFGFIKAGIEQKAFKYTIKPSLEDEMKRRNEFFQVVELKDLGKSKNMRIEGLVPRFEAGTIFIKQEHKDLIDELVTFPKGIHDDLADSLAYGLVIAQAPNGGNLAQFEVPEWDTDESY